jgi:hypothetical protein
MMRLVKIVLLVVLGLVVLAVGGVAVILLTVDFGKYKGHAAE